MVIFRSDLMRPPGIREKLEIRFSYDILRLDPREFLRRLIKNRYTGNR